MMNKIFAILPCYNEELNIGTLIDEWNNQKDKLSESGYSLVVVGIDDCSKDNTKKVIMEKTEQYDNVILICHEGNKGLCGGLNTAISYFLKNGDEQDYMVLMDGDNTHNPIYIHDMIKKLKSGNNDCVIASRYCASSEVVGVAAHREFMSDMAKYYYSFVLHVPNVKDYTCGYRLYTYPIIKKLVEQFGDEPIIEKSFACMMELLYKLYIVGAKFDEVGFELRYDNKLGASKMHVFTTMKKSLTTAIFLRYIHRKKTEAKNNMVKSIKSHSIPIAILLLITFAFSLTTRFSFYSRETFGHDACIFAYIGYAINQGQAPYIDAWDNKGPLLYLINALGIFINYRYGIFFIEILTLFITMIFLYKTALLFVPRWTALICTIFCILTLTVTLEGGNLPEEYALPFTTAAFYFIAKFFCNNFNLKKYEMMVVGACIGAVFLLRLNILAFLACAVLGVIIILIKNKKYQTLFTVTLFALLGFFIFLVPFVIYLIAKGAFIECIESAYFSTLGLFSPLAKIVFLKNIIQMIVNVIPSGAFFLIILFLVFFPFYAHKNKKETSPIKYLSWISFFGLIATLLANSLSGACNMHYFMSFIPVMIIPAVWFSGYIHSFFDKLYPKSYCASAVCAALALTLSISCIPKMYTNIFDNLRDGTSSYLNSKQMKVSNYLIENSEPTDTVQIIDADGDAAAITSYYRAKRLAASNYFCYFPGRVSDETKTEFANEIKKDVIEQSPKLIMFSSQESFNDFSNHLYETEEWYNMLNTDYILQENNFDYIIYKRKS